MRHLLRLLLPVILLMFSGAPALAQNGNWTVSEAKGTVLVIDGRGERVASPGAAVAAGATVRTRAQSSAVLVRGREFVTLRQNAQIRIPEAGQDKSIIQIIQDYGSALFNIGKQADPHFGVKTPYLAAVVKGTTFIIAVGADGATLQVTEGAVEASTTDGGARDLILPGAVAMVAANDPMRLVVEGEGRRVIDSPARPATTPAAATPAAASVAADAPATKEPAAKDDATDRSANRVDAMITSSPGDVRDYTGGFASGEVTVTAAAIAADNTGRGPDAPFNTDRGRGADGDVCSQGSCTPEGDADRGNVFDSGPDAGPGRGNVPDSRPDAGPDRGNVPDSGPGSGNRNNLAFGGCALAGRGFAIEPAARALPVRS